MRKKLMYYLYCFINCIDLSHHLAHHLIGPNHTPVHRKVFGVVIMVLGGTIVGVFSELTHGAIAHIVGDVLGNGIHGIGLIPFIKGVEKHIEQTAL